MKRSRQVAVAVLLLSALLFGAQAALAFAGTDGAGSDEGPESGTLVSVQSFGSFTKNNGEALLVRDGEVAWRYDPPNSRVFDAEMLDNGNVLVSVAEYVPNEECPPEFRDTERHSDHCVKNRVVELDFETKQVVWEHSWYDAFIHWHEVHDADRLPSGETAIIDMGNNRAFTVARNGTVTWEWQAEEHIGEGTAFFERHVPEGKREEYVKRGPEADWTHMNDIDRLENGNFALSIRNFDVVLEVNPETNEIVDVVGSPGNHTVMSEQHNPNTLERRGTTLVADSENDRVVEIDTETEKRVWAFDGERKHLRWPRDVDRLPNGNTLVTDSLNFRVVEVDENGSVAWTYSLTDRRGIVYSADRVGEEEEPDDVPSGRELAGTTSSEKPVVTTLRRWAAYTNFLLPTWVRVPELLTLLGGLLAGGFLVVDVSRERLAEHRREK